jgi:hypothetical protein
MIARLLDLYARVGAADALQIPKADVVARVTREQVVGYVRHGLIRNS